MALWMALRELSTGTGVACNAGHEKPAFRLMGGGLNRYGKKTATEERHALPWLFFCLSDCTARSGIRFRKRQNSCLIGLLPAAGF